ncbi:hypothetical protein NL676_004833 [Syzygium grande]|nr:hypothetical protein NL676_004833 [Syzygium grande]
MAEAGGFLLAFAPTIGGPLREAIYGLMMLHYGDLAWRNVLDDRSELVSVGLSSHPDSPLSMVGSFGSFPLVPRGISYASA